DGLIKTPAQNCVSTEYVKKTAQSPQPLRESYYRKVNIGPVRTRVSVERSDLSQGGQSEACPPFPAECLMVGTARSAPLPTLRFYPRRTLDPPSTGSVTPV